MVYENGRCATFVGWGFWIGRGILFDKQPVATSAIFAGQRGDGTGRWGVMPVPSSLGDSDEVRYSVLPSVV